MADQKLTDLPNLLPSVRVGTDLVYVVDVSAGTAGSMNQTIEQFFTNVTFSGFLGLGATTDALAASSSLYDSTDQDALSWKDADGLVNTPVLTLVATGIAATDTANIQAKITELSYDSAVTTATRKVLRLSGYFRINQPLTCGDIADDTLVGPCIIGDGATIISWVGSKVTTYLLTIGRGESDIGCEYLSGILFECNYNCRGLRIQHQSYEHSMRNVYVRHPRQVGIDMIDCWGSTMTDIRVGYGYGVAMRLHRHNATTLQNIKLQSNCIYESTGTGSAAMAEYEMENGRVACLEEYDGSGDSAGVYATDWPAVDDTSVIDGNGTTGDYVRTTEVEQAAFILGTRVDAGGAEGNLANITNLVLEGSLCGEYPIAMLQDAETDISGIRFEGNYSSLEKILIFGGTNFGGRRIRISSFNMADGEDSGGGVLAATHGCLCFVRCEGVTDRVKIFDGKTYGISTNMLIHDGGTHTNNTVENVTTSLNVITPANWIDDINGATVTYTDPTSIGTLADADTPVNSIYDSSDQGGLTYNDSDDVVNVVDASPIKNVKYVTCSWDADTDTANIKAAIIAVGDKGTVVLRRINDASTYHYFMVNETIDVGNRRLVSEVFDMQIVWYGTTPTDYVLTVEADGYLKNIFVNARHIGRGILFDNAGYGHLYDNITVYAANQVAVDMVDCWDCSGNDMLISRTRGIAWRLWRSNSTKFRRTRMSFNATLWDADEAEEADSTLVAYECTNGRTAAKAWANGGANGTWADDWPSTSDTTVSDGTNPVQTAVAERASIVCTGGGNFVLSELTIEPAYTGEDPVIYMQNYAGGIRGVRFEAGYHSKDMVILDGVASEYNRGLHINDVSCIQEATAENFIKLAGTTYDFTLSNSYIYDISGEVVAEEAGTAHSNVSVLNVTTDGTNSYAWKHSRKKLALELGAVLWLAAQRGIDVADGVDVTSWKDMIAATDLTETTNPPSFEGLFESVTFDGTAERLENLTALGITSYPLTMVARVKTVATSTSGAVCSLCDASATTVYYQLGIDSNGNVYSGTRNTTNLLRVGTSDVSDTEWHTIGAVMSGDYSLVFVDGVLEGGFQTNTQTFNALTDAFTVGCLRVSSPTSFFGGDMSDIAVFDSALTGDQMLALAQEWAQ